MSFYTSIGFTRPGKPPRITSAALASFLEQFVAIGLMNSKSSVYTKVRFGRSIDADDRPIFGETEETQGISRIREIKWDLVGSRQTPESLLDLLRSKDQPIYRAHLMLGDASQALLDHMNSPAFHNPKLSLALDSWFVKIGPVASHDLQSETRAFAGWVSVTFSGPGYLWPTTLPQLIAHLESSPQIRRAMDLCRQTWPVPSLPPDRATIANRKKLGTLWGFPESLNRPSDWLWTIAETG